MRQRLILLLTLVLSFHLASVQVLAQATPTTSAETEANEAIVQQVYDAFNAGNFDALDQVVAPDVVDHDAAPGQPPGSEGFKQALAYFRSGFADLEIGVRAMIADGEMVAVRGFVVGTHTGEFFGIPPTGRPIALEVNHLYRIVGGTIVEVWHIEDFATMTGQLGLTGAPPVVGMPAAAPPSQAAETIDVEANKALATAAWAAIEALDVATLDQLFAADFVNHNPSPGFAPTWEGLRSTMLSFRGPFPDQTATINHLIAEGDIVVIHATVRATHQGEAYGVPPTGRAVEYDGFNILRMANGKIVENWGIYEVFQLLMQIGAIPAPGAPPAATPAGPEASPIAGARATNEIDWAAYPELTIRVRDWAYEAPETIAGGLVAVTLENVGETRHMAMLVRPAEGVSIEELEAAILADPSEQNIRPLLIPAGGPGAIPPGGRQRVILDLEPGDYLIADFEGGNEGLPGVVRGALKRLTVVAPANPAPRPEPPSDAEVRLIDFAYIGLPPQFAAGTYIIKVVNDGPEPHELGLLKLAPGKTTREVFSAPPVAGEPEPYVVAGGLQDIAVGRTAWVELVLEPAEYGVFCAIPEDESGRPHLMLGMVSAIVVT